MLAQRPPLRGAGQHFRRVHAELTRALNLTKTRFETALRGADIYSFAQDTELRYTWVFSPRGEEGASKMLGRTDDDILASAEHDTSVAVKRRVLKSGTPEECEISYTMPEGRAVYAIRIFPTYGADRNINGIMCAAINISRIHSLESEQRLRAEKLETTLQRYDFALRGSNVKVAHLIRVTHRDEVEAPITGWLREAYEVSDSLTAKNRRPQKRRAKHRSGKRKRAAEPVRARIRK